MRDVVAGAATWVQVTPALTPDGATSVAVFLAQRVGGGGRQDQKALPRVKVTFDQTHLGQSSPSLVEKWWCKRASL